jgi:hypothetical protein
MEEKIAKGKLQDKRRRKGSIHREKGTTRARSRAIQNKRVQVTLVGRAENLRVLASIQAPIGGLLVGYPPSERSISPGDKPSPGPPVKEIVDLLGPAARATACGAANKR